MEFFCHLKRGNPEMDESNSFDQCSLTGTFRRFTQNSKFQFAKWFLRISQSFWEFVEDRFFQLRIPQSFWTSQTLFLKDNILDLCHNSGSLKLMPFWYLSMNISDFWRKLKMVMVSLIEKYPIRTKFQNDYGILKFQF